MTGPDLPPEWRRLLGAADRAPDGILALVDETDEDTSAIAERLTDLGLFRVVTARTYRLTDAGRDAITRRSATGLNARSKTWGWLRRLFGNR
ncbi:hypothetical protein HOY34_07755 [Xinfangfangia sp. D13-10-4-6]|uniref:hypothetical protein n=1 Tax=Pseudogemmobacter hezensis TaxID=2737662 RepID=UPI0015534AFE|nr:hypothetical protein [Pseudogemmobacter hezensis]NPD15095.1 hypothetical protein [Pseudogemmobacter hezensis]